MPQIPVYILAGGQSRRFGSDKARALLRGKPLILHVAEAIKPFASSITVVADTAGKYDDLLPPTLGDARPGLGPLGGLWTALNHARKPLLLVSCDHPTLRPTWIATLLESPVPDSAAFRGDRWQPMPALYCPTIAPTIDAHIALRNLSMQALLDAAHTHKLPLPNDWPRDTGVNSPCQLRDLEA